jgi:hypothetical protein
MRLLEYRLLSIVHAKQNCSKDYQRKHWKDVKTVGENIGRMFTKIIVQQVAKQTLQQENHIWPSFWPSDKPPFPSVIT